MRKWSLEHGACPETRLIRCAPGNIGKLCARSGAPPIRRVSRLGRCFPPPGYRQALALSKEALRQMRARVYSTVLICAQNFYEVGGFLKMLDGVLYFLVFELPLEVHIKHVLPRFALERAAFNLGEANVAQSQGR